MAEAAELERLRGSAAALGLELSVDAAEKLLGYERLVRRWNEKFNLVSRQDVERMRSRHLLDSLSIAPLLHGARILDIGSGAGLPGLPLAISHADRQFLLVDRSERKARFLEHAALTLDLTNVSVRCADAGELTGGEVFDTVVCRAVAQLESIWAIAQPRLAEGGRLLFMSRTGVASDQDPARAQPPGMVDDATVATEWVQVPGICGRHEVLVVEPCQ